MTTKNYLKDDIDLIKDFESLKLKQMILIESLKNNKNSNRREELIESLHDSFNLAFNSKDAEYENIDKLNIYKRIDTIEENISKILNLLENNFKETNKKDEKEELVEKSPPLPKF